MGAAWSLLILGWPPSDTQGSRPPGMSPPMAALPLLHPFLPCPSQLGHLKPLLDKQFRRVTPDTGAVGIKGVAALACWCGSVD